MSYSARVVAMGFGVLCLIVPQLLIAARRGETVRFVTFVVAVGITIATMVFVFYVRARPRLELKRRLRTMSRSPLFDAKIDAATLGALGINEITGVAQAIVWVDDAGLHVYPAATNAREVVVPFADILSITATGDDDPARTAGMVSVTLNREPGDLSITLLAPFLWGAFGAAPATTGAFVETVRPRIAST